MGGLDPAVLRRGDAPSKSLRFSMTVDYPRKKPSENRNLKIFGLGILVKRPEVFFEQTLVFWKTLSESVRSFCQKH